MSKNVAPLLYGTDPEMFAVYSKNGQLFTLPPFFFREKLGVQASDDPKHPIFLKGENFLLHEDGAAFEMSIPPSFNPEDLFNSIQEGAKQAQINILSQFPDYCLPTLHFLPTVGFEVERWHQMAKEEGKEFKEKFFMSTTFGCDPDFDAYRMEVPARTVDASNHPERYGGGHAHFSGSYFIEKDPIKAIKCLAMTSGLYAILNSDVPELEQKRTFLYGKPGKFRVQRYGKNKFGRKYNVGIEYRTPSNTWTKTLESTKKIFEWGTIGIKNLLETKLGDELIEEISIPVAEAILNCDQSLASELLSHVESKI